MKNIKWDVGQSARVQNIINLNCPVSCSYFLIDAIVIVSCCVRSSLLFWGHLNHYTQMNPTKSRMISVIRAKKKTREKRRKKRKRKADYVYYFFLFRITLTEILYAKYTITCPYTLRLGVKHSTKISLWKKFFIIKWKTNN